MAKIRLNESSIYYQEYGQGEPLLLIAGLASDSQSWLPVIIKLSKYFRVITFDNRGVGRSPKDNTNITIQKMTDDCVGLITQLNLSSLFVLGHSMGGMIAMDLAIRYPDLVNKLILEATAPSISMRNKELFSDWVTYLKNGMDKELWFRSLFYWIFHPDFFNNKEMLDQAVKMSIDYPYPQTDESFENQVKAVSAFNNEYELKNILAPTLIMHGALDILFISSSSKELFKDIPEAKYITIQQAAHSIHMDNPEGFTESLVSFLK